METTHTLKGIISSLGITDESVMVDHNPNMDDDSWAKTASHYRVTLKRTNPRRQMTVYFSMGPALCREPAADDVLDSLASDADGIENATSFENWASEYGYDTDSRKAERSYRVTQRQAQKLRAFMGHEYNTLLWDTERL